MMSTRIQCRENQAWCNSGGLEKWGHKMCRVVQVCKHDRQGAGDLMAVNNSSVINQRNADLERQETSFRGNKENKKKKVTNTCNRHHLP